MKTSLIQLTPAADWRAAVARIRGGAQGRVILVWPDKGVPSSPRLVLRLMQRCSLAKRVPLAVVSTDSYIRTEAEKLGLPLYRNARQARRENWALSQPLPAPQKPNPARIRFPSRSSVCSPRFCSSLI